jgi:hypothetical protein
LRARAAFGEVLVTLEKIRWLLREGERWLSPEVRVRACACVRVCARACAVRSGHAWLLIFDHYFPYSALSVPLFSFTLPLA